ncbi:hypothetical protein HTSR_1859 [Halodesulfurarchaeum formicicum]|uniref:Uncharacterized protein n=1 Tax=Halodesulfurarchaeum formicicum TaxID=1873524 RepID=A0A1D8S6N9_9EURY|nr:hypothetical protein [Halodesulfurarchaeum formicicum]AOW81024.1 hypothetical protein HTSR_1859 [Halodesulfurarchaeum formicicum]
MSELALTSTGTQSIRPAALYWPLAVWAVMAVLAVLNGGFREIVLVPRLGTYPAHVLSTLLLVAVIGLVAAWYFGWTEISHTQAELLLIGGLWTLLTIGFEFLVGFLAGEPVGTTLAQYDVLAGRIWVLVPIALFVAPLVFGR